MLWDIWEIVKKWSSKNYLHKPASRHLHSFCPHPPRHWSLPRQCGEWLVMWGIRGRSKSTTMRNFLPVCAIASIISIHGCWCWNWNEEKSSYTSCPVLKKMVPLHVDSPREKNARERLREVSGFHTCRPGNINWNWYFFYAWGTTKNGANLIRGSKWMTCDYNPSRDPPRNPNTPTQSNLLNLENQQNKNDTWIVLSAPWHQHQIIWWQTLSLGLLLLW